MISGGESLMQIVALASCVVLGGAICYTMYTRIHDEGIEGFRSEESDDDTYELRLFALKMYDTVGKKPDNNKLQKVASLGSKVAIMQHIVTETEREEKEDFVEAINSVNSVVEEEDEEDQVFGVVLDNPTTPPAAPVQVQGSSSTKSSKAMEHVQGIYNLLDQLREELQGSFQSN
jgi:hypothetical protein